MAFIYIAILSMMLEIVVQTTRSHDNKISTAESSRARFMCAQESVCCLHTSLAREDGVLFKHFCPPLS